MDELTSLFKALSDETRLRILNLLHEGELCVCDLVAALDMIQPKVSFHLNVLKEAGFIKDRKQGRWIHYRIDEADMFKRHLLLSVFEKTADKVIGADKRRLATFMKSKEGRAECVPQKMKSASCGC